MVEVKKGDPVFVLEYRREPVKATVTEAARVWLIITADEPTRGLGAYRKTWRMRRDTQQEKVTGQTPGGGLYQARFRTLEQMAAYEAYAQARATADQISEAVAELLSVARNDWDAERARQAQEALTAIGESASARLMWVMEGVA